MNVLIQLFWSFFQIGLFSIGGGYAAMPLIQNQVVTLHHWLTMSQFADIVMIAEMTPGPIAINSATFVGTQVAGLPGALIATAGNVLPSCIIVLTLAWVYYRYRQLSLMQGLLSGLRPVVIALIAAAGLSLCQVALFQEGVSGWDLRQLDGLSILLFAAALLALRKLRLNPVWVMVSAGLVNLVLHWI